MIIVTIHNIITSPPSHCHSGILAVREWGLQVAENGAAHHTEQYHVMKADKPRLVVRRGQPFTLVLHTSKAYKEDLHKISLVFSVNGEMRQRMYNYHAIPSYTDTVLLLNFWDLVVSSYLLK